MGTIATSKNYYRKEREISVAFPELPERHERAGRNILLCSFIKF